MQLALWQERAVLIRYVGLPGSSVVSREIIAEGSLADVVALIERYPGSLRAELLISLPDRVAPPLRYDPEEFEELVQRSDRPDPS